MNRKRNLRELMIYLTSSFRDYTLSSGLHDNGWHHLCLTWRNTDGRSCLFVDGTSLICTTNYQTGHTIPANGKFIIGQRQNSLGTVADEIYLLLTEREVRIGEMLVKFLLPPPFSYF